MERSHGPIALLAILGMVSGVAANEIVRIPSQFANFGPKLGKTQFVDVLPSNAQAKQAAEVGRLTLNTEDSKVSPIATSVGSDSFNLQLVSREASGRAINSGASSVQADSKSIRPDVANKTQKRRVLVFKASWCGACQGLNYEWPKLEAVHWKIGDSDTNHIQLVDADVRPDLLAKYGVSSLPTLLLVEDDKEIARHGLLTAHSIAELYYGRL